MSELMIEAGKMVRQIKGVSPEMALRVEARFDAIVGRKHALGLKDSGLPAQIGVELNDHLGLSLIRLGKMNERMTAEGRANDRSRAMLARLEAATAESIYELYGETP